MFNIIKKTLILGIFLGVAIAGVLVFYPTIVAPPMDVSVNNLHKSSLETNIKAFSANENTAFNDSLYDVVVDKLMMYKNEAFMTEEEIDYQTQSMVAVYVPIFKELSHAKFKASSWRASDHSAMLKRIRHLRTLKVDYNEKSALTDAHETDLRRIEQIISDYKAAREVASYSTFTSVSEANEKIKEAERYRKMNPLSNCTDLRETLSAVKSNIGKSHYDKVESLVNKTAFLADVGLETYNSLISTIQEYDNNRTNYGSDARTTEELKLAVGNAHYAQVTSLVNQLADYQSMGETAFYSLKSSVEGKIREYGDNRYKYGNNAESTYDLTNLVNEYNRRAVNYYSHKEIDIYTNGQWRSMSSPSTSYRAYESFGNYRVNSSEATMFFRISGYETFTFYIRSYGESNHDYVMVGKNVHPTTGSNYANTKGDSDSGTNLYNYESVTFNNLDKTSTYTIYVVYRKDGSDHRGSDRGYVLIPYVEN